MGSARTLASVMADPGTTIGMYIGPDDEEMLDAFDEIPGSRSANMKRAMALYRGVYDVSLVTSYDPIEELHPVDLRMEIRQLFLDEYQ